MNKKIKDIVNLVKEKPYKIAIDVGFKDVRENPHNEWMKNIINGKDDYTLMAHRGSYKSSCLSVCIALIMVMFPTKNIIFLRKADNDVFEMIRMVKKALESKIIQSISYILYQRQIVLTESTATSITTNLFLSSSGSSQLLGIGLKSSITGKHADIVITDDICNISDRISKAERERTKLQYQELQNIKNRGGRIINTGTKWHQDDVFSLMDNISICDCYHTGLISDEALQKIRDNMTASLFACNYELKIIASEDIIFPNPQTGGEFEKILNSKFGHIDAAYNGEDFTAFTIVNRDEDKIYVYGRLWRKHVDDVQDEITTIYKDTLCQRVFNETNGDKGYLAKELRKKGIKVNAYHESTNKFLKITSYLKGSWKNVIFVEGTDQEYIDQVSQYNENADHDDAPDSLASIIRVLPQKTEKQNEYKPIWN